MAPPTILGMDLLNFILAVFSATGAFFSILNYMSQIIPTSKFLAVVDALIETRTLWKEFEQHSNLSDKQMDQFFDIMDSLEDDVEYFIFIATPTCNLFLVLKAWFSTWSLIRLGQDVDKLRIGLLTLNSQRGVIERSREKMGKPDTPFVDFTALEKRYVATADAFIASFAGRKPKRTLSDDVEANAIDSEFMITDNPQPIPASWSQNNGRRRRPDDTPFRRAKRPMSTRPSISINSSQDTLVPPEPVKPVNGSYRPLNRYPTMGSSPNYLDPKMD